MKVLFIGDIVGRPGRSCVERWLPELQSRFSVDITVANAENAAGGLGVTPDLLDQLHALGIQGFTLGNHTWRKKALVSGIGRFDNVARPANYAQGVPGQGAVVLELADGRKLGVLNLLGRVFMDSCECPFRTADRELERLHDQTNAVLVDIHAEATSEKVALGWYLDGRCSAVVGTHTHVQTADERLLPRGTAYITDVGMTGPLDSVIGVEREAIIDRFLTGLPKAFEVATENPVLCGVIIDIDDTSGKARSISRIMECNN